MDDQITTPDDHSTILAYREEAIKFLLKAAKALTSITTTTIQEIH